MPAVVGGSPTRAAVYARNSKPPKGWRPSYEGEQPPGSWLLQAEKGRASAAAAGDAVVLDVHDVASGADPNRPAWAKVLAGVRGGHVHRVYATKLDRVMRDLRHFLEVADAFEKAGAELVFLDQPGASVRRADPAGRAFRSMLAVFAEFERDLTAERSNAVMTIGEDGRTYGPRSELPAGRPREYRAEDGHKLRRRRDGSVEHDRSRCRACRGGTGASAATVSATAGTTGLGEPVGSPTPEGSA